MIRFLFEVLVLLPFYYSLFEIYEVVSQKKSLDDITTKKKIETVANVAAGLWVIHIYRISADYEDGWAAGLLYIIVYALYRAAPVIIPAFFERGRSSLTDEFIRGSLLISSDELRNQIRAKHTIQEDQAITIGGVSIPPQLETQMFFVGGTTGAGKTQAINAILRTARHRNNKAIIADTGCGFWSRFGTIDDLILNPFDARTQHWSPFAEIEHDYDCPRLAKAAIPEGKGNSAEWHYYAQTLLAEVLLAMWDQDNYSIKQLLHFLTVANRDELQELLMDTPAVILCQDGNEKMLSNTRGIIATYLGTWRYLREGGTFSVRQWVRNEKSAGWLFLTYKDDQLAMLRNMVTMWLEIAIIEGLSLTEDINRRLFFIIDELDTLGRMAALRDGVTKLRKYGGVVVAGLQTIAQLRDTWGHDGAQTLLSCFSTKIIYRAGDSETAMYFESELGQQEIERTLVSQSLNSGSGEAENTSKSRITQSTVLASEIMQLENLHGYLKIPGFDVASFHMPYVGMDSINPPFEPLPRPAKSSSFDD